MNLGDPESRAPKRQSSAALVSLCVAVVGLLVQTALPLNWDVAWLVHVGQEVAHGADLYTDITEINPPLAIWMLQVPTGVAEYLGLDVGLCVRAAMFLALVTLAYFSTRMAPAAVQRILLPWLLLIAVVLPGADFGQRDHLQVALILPLTLGLASTSRGEVVGRRAVLASGVLAGIGFSLKPHALPVLIGLATMTHITVRNSPSMRRTLMAAIGATVLLGFAYVVAVLLLEPDYLPLVGEIAPAYLAWNPAFGERWTTPYTMLPIGALISWGLTRRHNPHRHLGDLFCIALAGSFASVVIQGKAFPYHFLPAVAFAVLLLPIIGYARRFRWTILLLTVLVVAQAVTSVFRYGIAAARRHELVAGQLADVPPGGRVLSLTHRVSFGWPNALSADWEWSSSFPSSWWLAEIIARHEVDWQSRGEIRLESLTDSEQALLARAKNDWAGAPPDIILTYYPDPSSSDPRYRIAADAVLRDDPELGEWLNGYTERDLGHGFRRLDRLSRGGARRSPAVWR